MLPDLFRKEAVKQRPPKYRRWCMAFNNLFSQPENSPWGIVEQCDLLCPGVFMIYSGQNGGTMVSKDMVAVLSPAARKCGFHHAGYICFDQESQEYVVLRELLDKKMWNIPDYIKDKEAYEKTINNTLQKNHTEYWRSRQRGREMAQARAAPDQPRQAEL